MLDKLKTIFRQECGLQEGQNVLAAVSGGPDSLCLLDLLWRLGYTVIVAHLDHGLRPASAGEAAAVQRAAAERGLVCIVERADTPAYAAAQGLSIEEAARCLRYRFLFAQAEIHAAQAVAVGHNADDQVETVLMHLLRGAGLSGLRGMAYRSLPNAWSDSIPLVRPLLGSWRGEIMSYAAEHGLQPSQDASNQDTRFFRNRLRLELIPYLESYNPGIKENLWRSADVLAEDYAALHVLAQAAWQRCKLESGQRYIAIDPAILQGQPLSIRRLLLRQAIHHLRPGLRDIDYAAIQRALGFLETPSRSGGIDLIAGLRLRLEAGRLYLADEMADLPGASWPQLSPGAGLPLELPTRLELGNGWQFHAELRPAGDEERRQALENPDPFQGWLAAEALELPLHLRARRPGERFQPLGMGGRSLKLSDLMINRKLPARARAAWPLLCSGEQIAWIPGLGLAHPYRVQEDTQHTVWVRVRRGGGDE